MRTIRVAELFAGVGGFRVGLEAANTELGENRFKVIWSNQWEPGTKVQHASDVYVRKFGAEGHSNKDISTVTTDSMPDFDLLVAGFPCQDYSVATTLKRAEGLVGTRGVLWWEIHRILREKVVKPGIIFLENVDRLLKSPVKQRGRDFAVMLASLADLGYIVEWRVINAADYGMPQRRRRVFIFGYLEGTNLHRSINVESSPIDWLTSRGVFSAGFPVRSSGLCQTVRFSIEGGLWELTERFNAKGGSTPFLNSGILIGRDVTSMRLSPQYEGNYTTLGDILVSGADVPDEFYIGENLDEWEVLKAKKSLRRVSRSNGHTYTYSEGKMVFPDRLDRPSRTIVTGEGGKSPSRFKHVVKTECGKFRRLVPVELERLNMFPDNHSEGPSAPRRAFLMGNALVTGIVRRAAVALSRYEIQAAESLTDGFLPARSGTPRQDFVSED